MAASNAAADLASATDDTTLAVADSAADVQDPHANAESDAADKPVLSKNQQKKLAKKERFAANKAAAKAAEKAAKQADTTKRREEVQQKFAAMTEEEREVWREERKVKRDNRKSGIEAKRSRLQQAVKEGQTIIVDCDFEEQMTENEIKSLCGQLGYCYSSNVRAAKPCHLCFTSLKGRIAEQAQHRLSGLENWPITHTQEAYLDKFQKQRDNLVYLTADSPNELSELDPTKRYIIGGIVDRNRHKNICFRKAEAQGIQTARLPIGAYMKLASSQVLTVNHVVEILLSWLELQDWQQAFYKVIPTRKRTNEQAADTSAGQGNGTIAIEGQQELEVAAQPREAADMQNVASDAIQTVTTEDAANVPQSADAQCKVIDVDSEHVSKRLRT